MSRASRARSGRRHPRGRIPRPSGRRDLPARAAGDLLDALGSRSRATRLRVTLVTTLVAQAADPRRRHAGCVPARDPPLSRPCARRHPRRAAARAPARGRRDRPARGVRPLRAARRDVLGDRASRSASRASPSCSRSCSSPGPFYLRTAIAAFEAVDADADRRLADARRRARPDLRPRRAATRRAGLGAGAALSFARGLGEFGATIMFAGSLQGVTQTLSLAVYEQFDVDFDTALAIGAELVVASAVLLFAVKLVPSWRAPRRSFPPSPLVRSRADARGRRGDVRARRPVGRRQVERAAGDRRAAAARRAAASCSTGRPGSTPRRGVDLPPERRSVGLVFQDYALFPHLTVRGTSRSGPPTGRAVRRAARAVPDRPPRRRTAGGDLRRRAPACRRRPCAWRGSRASSSSTSRCRRSTRTRGRRVRGELRELLAGLGLPVIVVTHDFEDAATLADRVGAIVDGRLRQVGSPPSSSRLPSIRSSRTSRARTSCRDPPAAGANGLTEVVLDAGGSMWSTDHGSGRVVLTVYPWEVALSRDVPLRLRRQPPPRTDHPDHGARQPRRVSRRAARRRGDDRVGRTARAARRGAGRRVVQGDRRAPASARVASAAMEIALEPSSAEPGVTEAARLAATRAGVGSRSRGRRPAAALVAAPVSTTRSSERPSVRAAARRLRRGALAAEHPRRDARVVEPRDPRQQGRDEQRPPGDVASPMRLPPAARRSSPRPSAPTSSASRGRARP